MERAMRVGGPGSPAMWRAKVVSEMEEGFCKSTVKLGATICLLVVGPLRL